jgi:hypothetical protein
VLFRSVVARLQIKPGHMDGMHCIIDGTSTLVKIKSVALYNCQTVYDKIHCADLEALCYSW